MSGTAIAGKRPLAQRRAGGQFLHLGDRHNVTRPRVIEGLRFRRLHAQRLPSLTGLRAVLTGTTSSRLSVPE